MKLRAFVLLTLAVACAPPPFTPPPDVVPGDDSDVWLDSDDVAHVYTNEIWNESQRRIRLYAPDRDYKVRVLASDNPVVTLDSPAIGAEMLVQEGHRLWLNLRARPTHLGPFRATLLVEREAPQAALQLVVEGVAVDKPIGFYGFFGAQGDCLPNQTGFDGTTRTPLCTPLSLDFQGLVFDQVIVNFVALVGHPPYAHLLEREPIQNPISFGETFPVVVGFEIALDQVRTATVELHVLRPDHSVKVVQDTVYVTQRHYEFDETGHAETFVALPGVFGEPLHLNYNLGPLTKVSWDPATSVLHFESHILETLRESPPCYLDAALEFADRFVGVHVECAHAR
ncbi:MAG: hypothetical protein U1E65_07610 [Myxococcota bacterium]